MALLAPGARCRDCGVRRNGAFHVDMTWFEIKALCRRRGTTWRRVFGRPLIWPVIRGLFSWRVWRAAFRREVARWEERLRWHAELYAHRYRYIHDLEAEGED